MQLPPFKLERFFAKYEFTARYLLCSSDCESRSVADLLALEPGAAEEFHRLWLGYTESLGAPALRQEISQLYTGIQPEQVLVCSGAEEAIFLFMQAALSPGDHVIVHSPCYQSLAELPQSLGCQVSRWQGHEEAGWALDLDELRFMLRPETRLVILNLPHNPTGYLMPAEQFKALNHMLADHRILLFSDEVYRESEHDPALRLPAACDLNEQAVSLGVMSKTYGLAGLRIGWVATRNAAILQHMAGLKDYTTICSSAPSEFLAALALRQRAHLVQRNVEIIRANAALADGFFERHASRFAWVRPKAGPIAFPSLLGEAVGPFCRRLVEACGVLLLPGPVFEDPGNHFRLGMGRANFPDGLLKLEEYLSHGRN